MARVPEFGRPRRDATALLGRSLCRRAGSRCELCGTGGVPLQALEVPPVPEEPEPDRGILVCAPCHAGLYARKLEDHAWHHLEQSVWSEVPAVQVVSVWMLRRLAGQGTGWATECLESIYLSPEVEEWVGEG